MVNLSKPTKDWGISPFIYIYIGKNTEKIYLKRRERLTANPKHTWSIQQALKNNKQNKGKTKNKTTFN